MSDCPNHENADFKQLFSFDTFIEMFETVKELKKNSLKKDQEIITLRSRVNRLEESENMMRKDLRDSKKAKIN